VNPLLHLANIGAAIALITFSTAFVLTLWPNRVRTWVAAALYAIGTWVSLGILARNYVLMIAMSYGLSDSGSANTGSLIWLLLPITAVIYALAAPALLWPSIPQAIAMRFGMILHLILIPLLIILMFAQVYVNSQGFFFLSDQLKWLVYGLVWLRIRESYRSDIASKT
jgi:hypothetical protein